MHVSGDHVLHLAGLDTERFQPFADRVDDLAPAFLGGGLVEAGIAHENAVRTFDHPDVIGDRGHLVVRIAEDVILRAHARVLGVADGIDLVDVIAHDFFSAPIVTPARRSIILTMAVKSESPPNSVLVISH